MKVLGYEVTPKTEAACLERMRARYESVTGLPGIAPINRGLEFPSGREGVFKEDYDKLRDAAVALTEKLNANETQRRLIGKIAPTEDHDWSDAPRTKLWVETHEQPIFSPDADYINALTKWACDLEREGTK